MDTRVFSAYNLARGVLLNSRLTSADSGNQPLKLLDIVVSGMGMDPTKGLWLTPLHGTPAVPRVFPFDLIYLDKEYRVLETAEMGPGTEFPVFQSAVASALVLPSDVLRSTGTVNGDRLIVCSAAELEMLLAPTGARAPEVSNPEILLTAAAAASNDVKRAGASIIELVPERPVPVHAARVVPGFERSIRSALAKAEDASPMPVNLAAAGHHHTESQAASALAKAAESTGPRPGESSSPRPPVDLSEAVFERSKQVFAPMIEHRIDPEDLFSNWVVSPPPLPVTSGVKPETLPTSRPVSALAGRNGDQNTPKPSPPDSGEQVDSPQTATAEVESPAVQPKPRVASGRSDKSAGKAKQNLEKTRQTPSGIPIPGTQSVSATTFTAVPYGMWQVSMPTAVAPAGSPKTSPGQSPQTRPPRSASSLSTSANSQRVSSSVTPADPPAQTPIKARDSKPQQAREDGPLVTAAPSQKEFDAAPKPAMTAPDAAQKHTPGDFVASLQEKLQRVQHSRPEPAISALTPIGSAITNSPAAPSVPQPQADAPEPSRPPGARPSPAAPSKFLNPAAADGTSIRQKREAVSNSAPSQPRLEKATPEPSTSSFRTRFKQWFNPVSNPSDRRRSGRRYVPGMVAHYFTGGAPKPHEVADISMSGMYLLTDDRWMPGTMIQMTLQKPCARGERKQSINVLSRIIRRGSDGVAAEFVMSETLSRVSHDIQPSQATDKFALARFL